MKAFLVALLLPLFWIALFLLPTGFVAWRLVKAKKEYEAEAQEPFTDLPLRLPGESTRKVAEQYFEKAMDLALLLMGVPAFFGLAVAMLPATQRAVGALVLGLCVLTTALLSGPRLLKVLRRYWNYQLGFKGERIVAEELNQLLPQGWRVFHDVPFDGFNVDHVAVGPKGVFVVETKTKRKWKGRATEHPAHIVKWDGNLLTWPSGARNDFGLVQTERNARTVAEFLSKSTGDAIECQPVLTLPGWWVEFGARGPIIVASTKGLHKVLLKYGSASLPAAQVQRIAYQLEQKCRPHALKES